MTKWIGPVSALALAGCAVEIVCARGETACGRSCAALDSNPSHCGACGNACAAGEVCLVGSCAPCTSTRGVSAGVCLPDAMVACFATDQVYGVAADLSAAIAPRKVGDGPVSLATLGGWTWASPASPDARTVVGFPAAGPSLGFTLGSDDLEAIRADQGLLFVSASSASSLVILDPALGVVDEVPLARAAGSYENPRGIAFARGKAYVALYGDASGAASFSSGQQIAVVGLQLSGPCLTPPCRGVEKRILLEGLAGAYDAAAGGLPFPVGALAVGDTVYVTLAHLKLGGFGYYTDPAGSGRVLAIDAAAGDALSVVDLGAGCTNPGSLAFRGGAVWVACGGSGSVLPIDVTGAAPAPGTPLVPGVVPGGLAFCAGSGYVTDQYSGAVVRFDPAGVLPSSKVDVCPTDATAGFAWAADVTCAP